MLVLRWSFNLKPDDYFSPALGRFIAAGTITPLWWVSHPNFVRSVHGQRCLRHITSLSQFRVVLGFMGWRWDLKQTKPLYTQTSTGRITTKKTSKFSSDKEWSFPTKTSLPKLYALRSNVLQNVLALKSCGGHGALFFVLESLLLQAMLVLCGTMKTARVRALTHLRDRVKAGYSMPVTIIGLIGISVMW